MNKKMFAMGLSVLYNATKRNLQRGIPFWRWTLPNAKEVYLFGVGRCPTPNKMYIFISGGGFMVEIEISG